MLNPAFRAGIAIALLVALAGLAGCSGSPQEPAVPTAPPPTDTPEPTATPRPTRTPTPVPPTPTATPTPSPAFSAANNLFERLQQQKVTIKSYRAQMEIGIEGMQDGEQQSVAMAVDMEMADPDAHMKMSGQGMPMGLDMEIVVKDDVLYNEDG